MDKSLDSSWPAGNYIAMLRMRPRLARLIELCIVAALAVSVAAAASVVNARDDEPSWEAIREYAGNYMQQLKKEGLSVRETANQLASSIWWSEKLQLLCPSYFYVNARRACYDYLLRQGTWNMMFGVTCH